MGLSVSTDLAASGHSLVNTCKDSLTSQSLMTQLTEQRLRVAANCGDLQASQESP